MDAAEPGLENAGGTVGYKAAAAGPPAVPAQITYTVALVGTNQIDLSGTSLNANPNQGLDSLNLAISDVAAQGGYIGAQINTLNSISQVMSTQRENVVSAQNAVQATDYASATSDISKYEILSPDRHRRARPGQQRGAGSDQAAAMNTANRGDLTTEF